MAESKDIKELLYQKCVDFVEARILLAQSGIDEAQRAANDETKSSVGDKYETGRAMMQRQRDQAAMQLAEALKLKEAMRQINPDVIWKVVKPGAVVETTNGKFFISLPAGKLEIEGETYYAISIVSPIGKAMKGLKIGEKVIFNGKEIKLIGLS